MRTRRRFHGLKVNGEFRMRECENEACFGRMHFYAFNDTDAEALFDLLDEHYTRTHDES